MTQKKQTIREQVQEVINAQPQKTVTVLSSLLAIEDAFGYIPADGIEEVAILNKSTANDVWAVASFYTNFRFEPLVEHVVEVCWGPSCHILGSQGLIQEVHKILNLETEGDTPGGEVTLKYITCLGACSQAPVVMVDHALVGNATKDQIKQIVPSPKNQKF